MAVGWVIWYMFLKSGIHPTIAGVMIAFTIPVKRTIRLKDFSDNMQRYLNNFCQPHDQNSRITLNHEQLEAIDSMENDIFDVQSPVQRLEHALHRFVTYVVMPVFALANAGVVLHGASIQNIFTGLSGVIEISMVLGKVLGIFIFSWLAVKLGLAVLPEKVKWNNIIGIGFLGGMGFTMSLFISNLAFNSEALLNPAKIGILVGSLIAGTIGYFLLKHTLRTNENE